MKKSYKSILNWDLHNQINNEKSLDVKINKTFEEFTTNGNVDEIKSDDESDLEKAFNIITSKHPESVVISDFDAEILNWVDPDWEEEEEYESEYEWYVDHNNGEAGDAILDNLINTIETDFDLSLDDLCKLHDRLRDHYGLMG
jgi:hypothetical protein